MSNGGRRSGGLLRRGVARDAGVVAALTLVALPAAAVAPADADAAATTALTKLLESYRARPALEVKSTLRIVLRDSSTWKEDAEVS